MYHIYIYTSIIYIYMYIHRLYIYIYVYLEWLKLSHPQYEKSKAPKRARKGDLVVVPGELLPVSRLVGRWPILPLISGVLIPQTTKWKWVVVVAVALAVAVAVVVAVAVAVPVAAGAVAVAVAAAAAGAGAGAGAVAVAVAVAAAAGAGAVAGAVAVAVAAAVAGAVAAAAVVVVVVWSVPGPPNGPPATRQPQSPNNRRAIPKEPRDEIQQMKGQRVSPRPWRASQIKRRTLAMEANKLTSVRNPTKSQHQSTGVGGRPSTRGLCLQRQTMRSKEPNSEHHNWCQYPWLQALETDQATQSEQHHQCKLAKVSNSEWTHDIWSRGISWTRCSAPEIYSNTHLKASTFQDHGSLSNPMKMANHY